MTEMDRIQDQARRAFEGEAWHGPALREVLADVDFRMAAAKPLPGAHSIWEIVLHVTAWKEAVRRRLEGEAVELTPEQDWPAPPQRGESRWDRALEKLERSHRRLLAAMGEMTDTRLTEHVPGRDHSFYFMLHGAVQHDLYHAGQIAVLRKGQAQQE